MPEPSLVQDEKAELFQHFFIGHVLQPSTNPRLWPSTALVPICQHFTCTGEPRTGRCTPDELAGTGWLCSCQYGPGCFQASLLCRHTAALCPDCLLLRPPDPFLQSCFLHSQTPAFESGNPANFLFTSLLIKPVAHGCGDKKTMGDSEALLKSS